MDNERADAAAREALTLVVSDHHRPSLSHTRAEASKTAITRTRQHHQRLCTTSASMRWYQGATGFCPLPSALRKVRAIETAAHRLRLGYLTADERIHPRAGYVCQHCGVVAGQPLLHYLLQCPKTRELRLPPLPAEGEDINQATAVVRCACGNTSSLISTFREPPCHPGKERDGGEEENEEEAGDEGR